MSISYGDYTPSLLLFLVIYVLVYPSSCFSISVNSQSFGTYNETIGKSVSPYYNAILHPAINVTIRPMVTPVFQLVRLTPAAHFIGFSFNSSPSAEFDSMNLTHAIELKRAEEFLRLSIADLKLLPDWSLWSDRSVLVFTIHRVPRAHDNCPSLMFCPAPGMVSMGLLNMTDDFSSFCMRDLTEMAGTCVDFELGKAYHILFPVSSALYFIVDRLIIGSELSFVVSAGYRLPPGVFHCPVGLFACPIPNSRIDELPKPTFSYEQRICLPLPLLCDGVVNCPDSNDFDEQNCENRSVPISSYTTDLMEMNGATGHLIRYKPELLHWIGQASLAVAGSSLSGWSSFWLFAGLFLLLIALILIGIWVYKKTSSCLRSSSTAQDGGVDHKDSLQSSVKEEELGSLLLNVDRSEEACPKLNGLEKCGFHISSVPSLIDNQTEKTKTSVLSELV